MKRHSNPAQFEWKQQSSTLRHLMSHPMFHSVTHDLNKWKEDILLSKQAVLRHIIISELHQCAIEWTPDTEHTA